MGLTSSRQLELIGQGRNHWVQIRLWSPFQRQSQLFWRHFPIPALQFSLLPRFSVLVPREMPSAHEVPRAAFAYPTELVKHHPSLTLTECPVLLQQLLADYSEVVVGGSPARLSTLAQVRTQLSKGHDLFVGSVACGGLR